MTERFISIDWGTSNLRARLASRPGGEILAHVASGEGVARLAAEYPPPARPAAFRRTLLAALEKLSAECHADVSGVPVIIAGMASSTLGWRELPYARLPFALDGSSLVCAQLEPLRPADETAPVLLLSGLCSENDILRGEETEALGLQHYLVTQRHIDSGSGPAVWIFPGTHSKHMRVEHGQVTAFSTYMTGELFDVLSTSSVLRHAIQPAATSASAADPSTAGDFQAGLAEARRLPLTNALFHVRTRAVLHAISGPANSAFLSALLIGSEIAALEGTAPPGARIVLAAAAKLAEPYRQALAHFGLADRATIVPPEVVATLSVRGHCVALAQHLADQ